MKSFLKNVLLITGLFLITTIHAETYTIDRQLNFATEATYPPFEFVNQSGEIQGFDIDIIKTLCAQMRVQCTFVNQSFASLIPSLQLGKYDAIFGAMNITPERAQQVDFTVPYYLNTTSIIALKTKGLTLAPESLRGKTIGVQAGTTLGSYLQDKYGSAVKVNSYGSEQAALLDLTSGRIDAVMGDTPLIQQWLNNQGKGEYVIVGQPINDPKYFGAGYGIAVRKGNTALLQELNRAITTIKNGETYQQIVKKYFGPTAQ